MGPSGSFEIVPYKGDNPLFSRGALCRLGDEQYLSHKGRHSFFWLGDTWWMGLTPALAWPEGFKTLVADRVEKGFSVVQIIAGLYPDMDPFDERGANEAGFPWDKVFHGINPAYFDAADKKIECLVENGIVPCIVGCLGLLYEICRQTGHKRHWQNIIARWGAYPAVWCLAGEANMTFYDDSSLPLEEHLKKSRKDWNDIAQYVHENESLPSPCHHPPHPQWSRANRK